MTVLMVVVGLAVVLLLIKMFTHPPVANKSSSGPDPEPALPTARPLAPDTVSAIQAKTTQTPVASRQSAFVVTVNGVDHDFTNHHLFIAIEPSIALGRWDEARRYLQKIAHGAASGTDAEKEVFKYFMMGFAAADPLYARCIQDIQSILQENPGGIRQTALYPHMAAAPDTETARYVLYYADLMGAIRRTKKGNSYTVFPNKVDSPDAAIIAERQRTLIDNRDNAPERAFDWVMREVELPSESARGALRTAYLRTQNAGHEEGVRAMKTSWPDSARWPSGEMYLRSLGWRPEAEFTDDEQYDAYIDNYDGPELLDLLYGRLTHVCRRIHRDAEVLRIIDPASPTRDRHFTHAIVNRFGWDDHDPCGFGNDKIISIKDALKLLEQPAHTHPACRCTVDPYAAL